MKKLKSRFNSFFFKEWFTIQRELTTPFEEISPQELKDSCLQRNAMAVWSLRTKIVILGNSYFLVLNYLTVSVYIKTIIHLSVGG